MYMQLYPIFSVFIVFNLLKKISYWLKSMKRMKKDTLASAITAAEFSVVSTLRGHGNHSHGAKAHGGIDLFDFTLMELYRLRSACSFTCTVI